MKKLHEDNFDRRTEFCDWVEYEREVAIFCSQMRQIFHEMNKHNTRYGMQQTRISKLIPK